MRRVARALAVFTLLGLMFQLGLYVPANGSFPVDWLDVRISLGDGAAAFTGLPQQDRGATDRSHYKSSGNRGERPQLPSRDKGRARQRPLVLPDGRVDISGAKRRADLSSATATTFELADGSFVRNVSPQRVNFKAADGTWQPINSRLVRRGDRWQTTAGDMQISLAGMQASGRAGSYEATAMGPVAGELASVAFPTGERFGYSLQGASSVQPVLDGSTASYHDILPGLDVELTATGTGLKETLVVKSREVAASWVFPLRLEGLTAQLGVDGSLLLFNAKGKQIGVIPGGWMTDAGPVNASGERPVSGDVQYELITVDGGQALKVTASRSWLDDPARVFPVRVDPSIFVMYAEHDVVADDDSGTNASYQQFGNSIAVGYDGADKHLAYLKFDDFEAQVNGAHARLTAASLNLFHTWSSTCGDHLAFTVNQVNRSWDPATVASQTYAQAPGLGRQMGTKTITDNYPACNNTSGDRDTGQWASVDLVAQQLVEWATGVTPNYGFVLNANQADSKAFKRFTSQDATGVNCGLGVQDECRPYLQLTYEPNDPPEVKLQLPEWGAQATTLTPQLYAEFTDPNKGPNSLKYLFEIFDDEQMDPAKQTLVESSGWITQSKWTVGVNKLKWGGRYRWSVRASDGANGSGSIKPEYRHVLTTNVPQTLVTSTMGSNGEKGFAAGSAYYTNSVTDAQVASVGPALAIQRSYHSADARGGRAFGPGWSSLLDSVAVDRGETVLVTYPSGQDVAFGKNNDGTYSAGLGRFSTFTAEPSNAGFRLVDKDGTTYLFDVALTPAGRFGLHAVTDAVGRTLTLDWSGSQIASLTSASGRRLFLTWVNGQVTKVATDLVSATEPALEWTYQYQGGSLWKVFQPGPSGTFTEYSYVDGNLYPATVQDMDPSEYWRLGQDSGDGRPTMPGQPSGSTSVRNVVVPMNPIGVTQSEPGPLDGSSAKSAKFNGTSSSIAVSPPKGGSRAIAMWVKVPTDGINRVLYGQSWVRPTSTSTTNSPYQPVLYVGADGKLVGGWPTAPAVGSLGSLTHDTSGMCVNVYHALMVNGTNVDLFPCDGRATQKWELTSLGELKVIAGGTNKCMYEVGATAGQMVGIGNCDGAAKSKWRVSAGGQISSQESELCLSPVGEGTASETRLEMRPCKTDTPTAQAYTRHKRPVIESGTVINDGAWHHIVLSANGNSQDLFIDGVPKGGNLPGIVEGLSSGSGVIGAGYLGGDLPNHAYRNANHSTGQPTYFNGWMAEVATFDRPITATHAAQLFATKNAKKLLSQIKRPSGGITATVSYDALSGQIAQIVDSNGGTWKIPQPYRSGSSQVYVTGVLSGQPTDYWRMDDPDGSQAVNVINGHTATYSGAEFGGARGGAAGPFFDTTAPYFNGVDDSMSAPGALDVSSSFSWSGWVNPDTITSGYRTVVAKNGTNISAFNIARDPASGKWYTSICATDVNNPCTKVDSLSPAAMGATADSWTHLAATYDKVKKTLKLYVNGVLQGSATGTVPFNATGPMTIARAGTGGFLPGRISEVATYRTALTDAQINAQYSTANKSVIEPSGYFPGTPIAANGSRPTHIKTVPLIDPTNKTITQMHNFYTGQQVASIDALGYMTMYGYDAVSGFMNVTVDPDGNKTELVYDVRGNVIEKTAWQDQANNATKTTSYYKYFPDATTRKLTPNPCNDVLLEQRDGRSASATDNTYRTTFTCDSQGRITHTTDALGRVTLTEYGIKGLPVRVTTPGGAVTTTTYLPNGDVASVVDAAGKTTEYQYDGIGRAKEQKVTRATGETALITTYSYAVNATGRLETQTDPAVLNRVTNKTVTAITVTQYNVDGQPKTVTVSEKDGKDLARTVEYDYNALGQKEKETDAGGKYTTFLYDLYGKATSVTDPNQTVTKSVFDAAGNLLTTSIGNFTGDPNNPQTAQEQLLKSYAYYPSGKLWRVTDIVAAGAPGGFTTEYDYYSTGWTKRVTRTDGTDSFVTEENVYDKAGNVTRKITNNGQSITEYAVDAAARTTSSTLDPAGLKRTTAYGYSTDDHVTSVRVKDGSGATTAYSETTYDELGRELAEVTYPGTGLTPVARWKLDGSTLDSAGNQPGTATNVSWSTEHGGSATFDGSTSLLTSGPVVNAQAPFTVSTWVKLGVKDKDRYAVTMAGPLGSAVKLGYNLSANKWIAAMAVREQGQQASAWVNATAGTPQVNTWTHLAATVDPHTKTLKLFVDGVEQASTVGTLPFNNQATSTQIGASGGERWQGALSDVQVYQKTLSSAEITQVFLGAAQEQDWGGYRDFASGDFNQDNKSDFVAIRVSDGMLARWSGNGDGTFTYAGNVSGGWSGQRDLVAADFDSDGKTDLMSIRTSDNIMRRWKGTGPGTFAAPVDLVGSWAADTRLVTADINGDTKADVIAVRNTDWVLRFYLGNGAGGFSSSSSYGSSWDGYENLMAADFTGDGKADLMAIDPTGLLGRWPGNGNSTLQPRVPVETGWTGHKEATSGDFSGDGKQDFYAVRNSDGNIARRHNTGTGAFTNAGDIASVMGSFPSPGNKVIRTSITRDDAGIVRAVTDPGGNITTVEIDAAGRPTVTSGPAVSILNYGGTATSGRSISKVGYDTFGAQINAEDPAGNETTMFYNTRGHLTQVTGEVYNGVEPITMLSYDDIGRLVSTTDPMNHTTTQTFDQLGRVASVKAADDKVTKYKYDLLGNPASVIDPSGAESQATYDYLGRKETTTQIVRQDSASYITEFSYHAGGWLSQVKSPEGVTSSSTYNAAGEPLAVTDGAGAVTAYQYDGAGRRVRTTLPDSSYSTVDYDLAGRALKSKFFTATNVMQVETSQTYDRQGNVVSATDGRNHTTNLTYDAASRLIQLSEPVTDTDSIVSTFDYDAMGRQTRFTNGRGHQFWTEYNTLGLPASTVEPGDAKFTSIYDAAGRLIEQRSPGNVTVAHELDAAGRVKKSTGTGAEVATSDKVYEYDAAGRLKDVIGSGGSSTLTWNDRNELISVTNPSGGSSFTYNKDGQMKTRTDAAGTTSYSYDTAGRLKTASHPNAGSLTYTYNPLSQPDTITYGGGNKRTLGYDERHRLKSDELKTSGGATLGKVTYLYDGNSNLISKATTGVAGAGSNSYGYDYANRLTSWTGPNGTVAYGYDKAGNRAQAGGKSFVYNGRNQLESANDGTTYTYTPRGTLKTSATGTVTHTTDADAFGQVTKQDNVEYTYDGLGRAIKPGFAYSGLGNDLATDGTTKYIRGAGGDLLASMPNSGSCVWAWTDQHQDVIANFTSTGTVLSGSQTFDPWGKQIASAGMVGTMGYQSEYTESATGRVNMHARWYNPDTAQFDSRDTVSNSAAPVSANANRYGYGNANPLTNVDPSGHGVVITQQDDAGERWYEDNNPKDKEAKRDDRAKSISGNKNHKRAKKTSQIVVLCAAASTKHAAKCPKLPKAPVCREGRNGKFIEGHDVVDSGHTVRTCTSGQYTFIYMDLDGSGPGGIGTRVLGGKGSRSSDGLTLEQWVRHLVCRNAMSKCVDIDDIEPDQLMIYIAWLACHNNPDLAGCPNQKEITEVFEELLGINDVERCLGLNEQADVSGLEKGVGCASTAITIVPIVGWLFRAAKGAASTIRVGNRLINAAEAALEGRAGLTALTAAARCTLAGADIGVGVIGILNSFDPKTKVLLAGGHTKPIGDIQVGDKVVATDPEQNATSLQPVTDLHVNLDTELTDLTLSTVALVESNKIVDDGKPTTTLHTTQHHPFWDATTQKWTDAADLVPGVSTLIGPDGQTIYVMRVRSFAGAVVMNNLTIANLHTFYVLAGNTPVLVHNDGDDYLYRGVYFGHPDYENAKKGIAIPWGGHDDAGLHAGGDNRSNFTSWTDDFDVAMDFSRDGNGPGIILRVKRSDVAGQIASGNWGYAYDEAEVTLHGKVTGADVRSSVTNASFGPAGCWK